MLRERQIGMGEDLGVRGAVIGCAKVSVGVSTRLRYLREVRQKGEGKREQSDEVTGQSRGEIVYFYGARVLRGTIVRGVIGFFGDGGGRRRSVEDQ